MEKLQITIQEAKLVNSLIVEPNVKDVDSMNDGQLKALLDEAIQYKCPKDREGKSKTFRELLSKVEADEDEYKFLVGVRGSGRRALRVGRSSTVSERDSRGGSLQNIFHAATNAEFDTHHSGGGRRKNKSRSQQGPGGSVSARQREGGSLPSNVNAGWSWQSDQKTRTLLFDSKQSYIQSSGAPCITSPPSNVVTTQARRQTLMHSASNELPSSRKQNTGELYPLRRHNSSSDQSKSESSYLTFNNVKTKSQSESSSGSSKMSTRARADHVSVNINGLDLDTRSAHFQEQDGIPFRDKYIHGLASCDMELEPEVYTSQASIDVDSDNMQNLRNRQVTMAGALEAVPLDENYQSVKCIVSDDTRVDEITQSRLFEGAHRHSLAMSPILMTQMTRGGINVLNVSSKLTGLETGRVDENGNAVSRTNKKNKRKTQSEKNVVETLSQHIRDYKGDKDLKTVLSFIESDNQQQHKTQGKAQVKKSSVNCNSSSNSSNNSKSNNKNGNRKQNRGNQLKKSTSYEEISGRNIDDLTEGAESERSVVVRKPRKQSIDEESRDRRSWADQMYGRSGSQTNLTNSNSSNRNSGKSENTVETEFENNSDSEFQMVTKKQRKRKCNDNSGKRDRNERDTRRNSRRKSTSSVPPSEKSLDSDHDSVHSLPVGGTRGPVSYADIARVGIYEDGSLIQDWCDSVNTNFEVAELPPEEVLNKVKTPLPQTPKDIDTNCDLQCDEIKTNRVNKDKKRNFQNREDFPSLPVKIKETELQKTKSLQEPETDKHLDLLPNNISNKNETKVDSRRTKTERSDKSKSLGTNSRPPVILLHDERVRDKSVCEITFGFEVNELLLTSNAEEEQADCNNITNNNVNYRNYDENENSAETLNVTVKELFKQHQLMNQKYEDSSSYVNNDIHPTESKTSTTNNLKLSTNFLPPPDICTDFNHDKIVTFVGMAWEDALRTGEVQYYTGEN